MGMFHNDIKPNNIMVNKNGDKIEIYLIDLDSIYFEERKACTWTK